MYKNTSGFTIIELLVVIAVIGILSTISLLSFNRFQANSRDSQRSSSATIISEALEKYYDQNGEYPSCNSMTGAGTAVAATLDGVDQKALVAPRAAAIETNSIDFCATLAPSVATDSFAYVGDGSAACTTTSCLLYTLQYKEEGTGNIISLNSRRTTDIATSTNVTDLAVSSINFTQINLTWTTVPNASSYAVERSTSAGFSVPANITALPSSSTNSSTSTGLTAGTQYWYRVAPIGAGTQGSWSNIATTTTPELSTPNCTATANGVNQIVVTWTAVSLATSYTLQFDNNSGFTSATIVNSLPTTPLSYTISGLTAGTTRFVQVRAAATGDIGEYCAFQSATTPVPAPTCLSATTNSTTQITASWAACPVAVAQTYTLQYDDNSGFATPTSITGLVTTSRAVTGLTEGKTYWFRVYALVGTTSSTASPSASATTAITAPTGVSISSFVPQPNLLRRFDAGDWIVTPGPTNWYYASGTAGGSCAAGTTREMYFSSHYDSPITTRGPTGWGAAAIKYDIQPVSGSGIRFIVYVRCVGTNATSGIVSATSGYSFN